MDEVKKQDNSRDHLANERTFLACFKKTLHPRHQLGFVHVAAVHGTLKLRLRTTRRKSLPRS